MLKSIRSALFTNPAVTIAFVVLIATFAVPPLTHNPFFSLFTYNSADALCANCTGGGGGGTITPPPSGTLSSANSCTIPIGGSTCSASFSWTTSNTKSTVTTGVYMPNRSTALRSWANTGESSSATLGGILYGNYVYYLETGNTATLLSTTTVQGVCASGSTWTGSDCAKDPPAGTVKTVSWKNSSALSASAGTYYCGNIDCNVKLTGGYVKVTYEATSSIANGSSVRKGEVINFTVPKANYPSTDPNIGLTATGDNWFSYGGATVGPTAGYWTTTWPSYEKQTASGYECTAPMLGGEYAQTIVTPKTTTISPTGMSCTGTAPNFTCTVTSNSGTVSAKFNYPATTGAFRPLVQSYGSVGLGMANEPNKHYSVLAYVYNLFVPRAYAGIAQPTSDTCGYANSVTFSPTAQSITFSFTAQPPTGSISATPTCTVPAGSGTCPSPYPTVTWSTSNATSPRVYVSANGGGQTLMSASASGSTGISWIQPKKYTFTLEDANTGLTLGTAYITGSCASGSTWNGSTCVKNLPDLISSAASPSSATAGSATTLSATITNQGNASTGSSFYNIIQVATASGGGGTISTLSATSMSALAAGASNTTSHSYTFPSSGTYSVRACADKSSATNSGTITESNENNNCGAWTTVSVAPAPVNGVCSSTHYNCSAGTSSNNVNGTTSYTWSCVGSGGGSTASCSEAKPVVNGACSSTHYSCTAGTSSNNVNGTTSYTWSCVGSGGGSTASCSESKALPDLISSAASPSSATAGSATTLSATITNQGNASTGSSFYNIIQVATASGGGGTISTLSATSMSALAAGASNTTSHSYTFPSSGTYSVRACADKSSATNSGTITESNENNNCGAWTTVSVAAPAPTATLTASPGTIDNGQSTTLTWSSTNATSCTAAGGFSTGGATSGSASVSPANTSTYQVTCNGAVASTNVQATVTVVNPTQTISADPQLVKPGGSSTITWSSTNTKSCVVSGPGLYATSLSGSQSVTISTQSTYTIACDSLTPSTATVNVTPTFQEF